MKHKLIELLKKYKKNEKGFTLIEMIVVIAIIGVLAAILVPTMNGYISDAQESKREANARTLYTASQAAVTSVMADGTAVVAGTVNESTTINAEGTFDQKVKAKVVDLMGADSLDKLEAYTIRITDNGSVSVSVTEDGQTIELPTASS